MTKLRIVDARTMEQLPPLRLCPDSAEGEPRVLPSPGRADDHHAASSGTGPARPLIRSILRDIDVSPEQFAELLRDMTNLSVYC